ncbi:phospholipase D-like domain-containing protein [Alicyclobacillus sp. SO9]|uniref:phospholipase D-like domain-containing protein n=1 Tax=Alicyclobacillus sp. SO9 TaxID=2665646 RepID=UPI0018E7CC6A|nr:phospholipase D-like domain-containing protein [Alicyclobacillus sp. SO9]QQE78080.1 hypothetical protein GI364_19635 [Alicyclobacillus sp. SO9]
MAFESGLTMKTYFSPEDDTTQAFLNFLQSAKKTIHIAIFAFHLPLAMKILLEKHKEGLEVRMVIDHREAHGRYEHPEIKKLRAAGIPVIEGTSQEDEIMHHKFAVIDGESVLAGSWNFSETASKEDNYFDIVTNTERAQLFLKHWHNIENYMSTHDAGYNPQLQQNSNQPSKQGN